MINANARVPGLSPNCSTAALVIDEVIAIAPGATRSGAARRSGGVAQHRLSRVTTDAIVRPALSPGSPVLALIKSTSIEVLRS